MKNNKSENFQNRVELIKENEKRAARFLKKGRLDDAEKALNSNLKTGTKSSLTYDLLLAIEEKKNSYSGVIRILEYAIKHSGNKEKYRKLRKKIIMKKLLSDMNNIYNNENTTKSG